LAVISESEFINGSARHSTIECNGKL